MNSEKSRNQTNDLALRKESKRMNELVLAKGNDVFTDSMVIANGTNNQHESVVALLKTYSDDFLEFGKVEFTDLKSGKRGRPVNVYLLNEEQSTLLITYLENTAVVRQFKKELIKQFCAMRRFIMEKQSLPWQEARSLSKQIHKQETDSVKLLVEYAQSQGSQNAKRYYANISTLANKAAGIEDGNRDNATMSQLGRLILIENVISDCIREGIRQQAPYKGIYRKCRERIEQFGAIAMIA